MKLSTILNFVILIFFTLLFVNDFFPDTAIAAMLTKKIILLILVGLVIIQLAFDKGRYKRLSKKAYIGLTLYTVGLWIVLTLLGGQSQIGLSFTSPLFYIIVVLLGLDLLRLSRQTKRDQTEEKAK
ncbi:hypothetical protein M5J14_03180 [Lysinibacillus sp. OL1_EC]|uniref:hypothetical protein n=1 Tax=unclassified Lysinibacillus TaxID=2636778 RepID=UPI00103CDB37|nr:MULTISPECIES: hypothetical protein [unclassified Lysinibacillus]MCM0623524.1 hypothetical protein [Lysinibacillus sp. OL1_EC]MCS5500300.1 hypothetical protein [Lysinibacillus sp. A4]TBV89567.1 hypothetical protein EW028_01195 [Lysinibacillus sp. OL1]UKJ46696.1 hypothetical protein L6W14_06550 [Lysinibacillus sp. ACHW1.5]WGT38037.1 hypothetical protein QH639_19745 [Lysinibacillus sp. 1 U-2021]